MRILKVEKDKAQVELTKEEINLLVLNLDATVDNECMHYIQSRFIDVKEKKSFESLMLLEMKLIDIGFSNPEDLTLQIDESGNFCFNPILFSESQIEKIREIFEKEGYYDSLGKFN